MAELVSWAYGELDSGRNHPLIVIGAFISGVFENPPVC